MIELKKPCEHPLRKVIRKRNIPLVDVAVHFGE